MGKQKRSGGKNHHHPKSKSAMTGGGTADALTMSKNSFQSNKQQQRGKKNRSSTSSSNSGWNKSSSDLQLQQRIEADGSKSVITMAADGNCLFRSVSDQLYHDHGKYHDVVRGEICDYLQDHADEFRLFLVLDDEDAREEEDATDFDQYVANMRRLGEWGTVDVFYHDRCCCLSPSCHYVLYAVDAVGGRGGGESKPIQNPTQLWRMKQWHSSLC